MKRREDKNWHVARAFLNNELSGDERAEFETQLIHDQDLVDALEDAQYAAMTLRRISSAEHQLTVGALVTKHARNWLVSGMIAVGLVLGTAYSLNAPVLSVHTMPWFTKNVSVATDDCSVATVGHSACCTGHAHSHEKNEKLQLIRWPIT